MNIETAKSLEPKELYFFELLRRITIALEKIAADEGRYREIE